MEFFERISGARMHMAFYKPLLNSKILNKNFINDLLDFTNNCLITLNEINNILTTSKI